MNFGVVLEMSADYVVFLVMNVNIEVMNSWEKIILMKKGKWMMSGNQMHFAVKVFAKDF